MSGSQLSLRAESLQEAFAEDNNSPAQAPGSLFFPSRGAAAGATPGFEIEQRGLALGWEGGRSSRERDPFVRSRLGGGQIQNQVPASGLPGE